MQNREYQTLRNCPFCGGRGARLDVTWEFKMLAPYVNTTRYNDARFYVIECFDCHARTQAMTSEDEAIRMWERRESDDKGAT